MLKQTIALLVWLARVAILLLTAAIFTPILSGAWGEMRAWFFDQPDKVLHFIGMFLLTFGALIALPSIPTYFIWIGAIGLAGAVELVQISGPRSADWMDFLCSAAGVLTIALAYHSPVLRSHFAKQI